MSNEIVQSDNKQVMELDPEIISSLVLAGDLSKLDSTQKVKYYSAMCKRIGLDPATQPFKLMKLQGKEVMYCDRSGAAQLNKVHKISHQRTATETVNDVFIVYIRATAPDGRFTESSGAVSIKGLSGDSLANAIMKAETKAKRRSTLDLVGLGILDETELETIPNAKVVSPPIIQKTAPLPEPTKEELEAKAAEAKAKLHAQEASIPKEEPKSEPGATEGPSKTKDDFVVKGKITKHYPPTGKGPHSFKVEGFDPYLKTFDEVMSDNLIDHMNEGDVVEITYGVTVKNGYSNHMIVGVAVQR